MKKINIQKILTISFALLLALTGLFYAADVYTRRPQITQAGPKPPAAALWPYQCIDTVKFSRDTARDWDNNQTGLTALIERQLSVIKELGANCVSIGVPYDEEFAPFLSQWVSKAREKNLAVWFRGNFAGWEGWFSYPRMSSVPEHHRKTLSFITGHEGLFLDGDIFTPAPEPENGLLGNPFASRDNRDILLKFVSDSFVNCRTAFGLINKKVACGYFSTNGSVAKEILTPELVARLGGTVTVDHYVSDNGQMALDIKYLQEKLAAKVALGEFGAPIPDIHGAMDEAGQAAFVKEQLKVFYDYRNSIEAINYWTLSGGTTALLREDGSVKPAADELKKYFKATQVAGKITDGLERNLEGVEIGIQGSRHTVFTDGQGEFALVMPAEASRLIFKKQGYEEISLKIDPAQDRAYSINAELHPSSAGLGYSFRRLLNFAK